LVTAGGTREPVDSVRFLGNRSSGRMGIALAAAAKRRGADVTLVAANISLVEPPGVRRIDVETTEQLAAVTGAEFPSCHVLAMAAAPADFRAAEPTDGKLTRDASLDLRLEPTEDILAGLGASKVDGQTVVAFAAEAGENVDRAREKLTRKKADLIVFNDISNPEIGFESQENAVTLIDSASADPLPRASKDVVAEKILQRVDQLRSGQAQPNR
jgi:phosphopantothenoylcysteine decarboxylase/phosphopantothenate--cysteine ligase